MTGRLKIWRMAVAFGFMVMSCNLARRSTEKKNKKGSSRKRLNPLIVLWCRDQDSNQGHSDFQSDALPTELSRQKSSYHILKSGLLVNLIS